MQNKPNFPRFYAKNGYLEEKQTQSKPIQTQFKANQTQFKANFRKAKMNVNSVLTMDYVNIRLRSRFKNKPNSNPIQSQFPKGQNERKFCFNKGL